MSLTSYVAPLAERAYRRLWVGQTISSAGDALVIVAGAFAVLRIGGTAADIGYVAAISAIIRVAFSLAGGVWADRLRRQVIMLGADIIRAAVQAILGGLIITGHAHVWELVLGAAVYGAAQSFFGPASAGLIPETVPAEQLQQANALMGSSVSFWSVSCPAIAGILVAAYSPGIVYIIDAATFVVSAISLALLRLQPRPAPEHNSFLQDLADGWHELTIRPWCWLNLVAHAFWNFAIPSFFVLGPVICDRSLGGASAWGLISAAWAVGAVMGGALALRVRPRRPLVWGNRALVLGMLPLLALASSLSKWQIAIAAALGGAGMIFLNSVWMATMQELIPSQARSRVDSYDWLVSLIINPAGLALVGPAAARFGDTSILIIAAFTLGIPCFLITLLPAVRFVYRTPDGNVIDPILATEAPELQK